MAAYAVLARIDRVDPHLAGRAWADPPDRTVTETLELAQAVDLVGRPLSTIVAERLDRIREVWAQTTFYLFDANSWR
jgi:hypothetical protein